MVSLAPAASGAAGLVDGLLLEDSLLDYEDSLLEDDEAVVLASDPHPVSARPSATTATAAPPAVVRDLISDSCRGRRYRVESEVGKLKVHAV